MNGKHKIIDSLQSLAVSVGDIRPDPANAREGHDIESIADSLNKYGQRKPIVVNQATGTIEAGNGTYQAAKMLLGWTHVAAVMVEDDPLTATGYAIADNRLTDKSSFNMETLGDLLGAMDDPLEVPGIDLDFLNEIDLNLGLNGSGPGEDTEPQIDRAEELRVKWGVEVGQLWQLGDHRLICGDCTDKAAVERVMGGERADLGVTSPPYAVGKEYEIGVSFDDHLSLLRGMADRAKEAIKIGGFLFTNFGEIAPQSHSKPLTGSNRQCLYLISKDYWQIFHVERGMDLYAQRIWYKPFNRLQQPFWTYHTSIPHYQEWEHIWTWRLPGGEGDEVYDWDISSRAIWDTRSEATDDKPLTRHVAAFPVGIPERAIKAHSKTRAIVWEPFSGSGTTLIAAHNLARRARCVEIDPGYVAVTLQRFLDHTGIQPELINE